MLYLQDVCKTGPRVVCLTLSQSICHIKMKVTAKCFTQKHIRRTESDLSPHYSFVLSVKQGSCKYCFQSFRHDSTRKLSPIKTDCETNALTTTPLRFLVNKRTPNKNSVLYATMNNSFDLNIPRNNKVRGIWKHLVFQRDVICR